MKKAIDPKLMQEILEFNDQIEYVKTSGIGVPKHFDIDLSVAHNNLELNYAGNFLYAVDANSTTDLCSIRFNEVREPAHNYTQQFGFYTPYHRIFLSNTAQVGATMRFIYGTLAKKFLDILDNRSQALQAGLLQDIENNTDGLEDNTRALNPDTGTQVNADAFVTNGNSVIYTVGAGDTLILTNSTFHYSAGNVVSDGLMEVRNGGGVQQYRLHYCSTFAGGTLCGDSPQTYAYPIIIPENWDIRITSNNAQLRVFGFIHGFIE